MYSNIGVIYARLFQTFVSAASAWSEVRATVQLEEIELIGGESWEQAFNDSKKDKAICEAATRVFDRLCHHASRVFSVGGRKLDLPVDELREEFLDKNDVSDFQPGALWDALVARYGGVSGERESFTQAARDIENAFTIKPGMELQTVAGRVVLPCQISADSSKWSGKTELCYHSAQKLKKLVAALRVFAAWGQDVKLQHDLGDFLHARCHTHVDVVTREKISVCEELIVVTYRTRYEFRFSIHAAQTLQVFLGEFGTNSEPDTNLEGARHGCV